MRFLLTLAIGFCLWYGMIGLTLEEKALKAAKAGIQVLIGHGASDPSEAENTS